MSQSYFSLAALAFGSLLSVASPGAQAAPYSANYVFGDSLSDRGNLAEALGHNFNSPPFFHDSFSNGPTAVEVFSNRLGLTANPSLFVTGFVDANGLGLPLGGTSYAVAGATAGNYLSEGVPGGNLSGQVGAFLARSSGIAPSSALYTVFIGGNDVRNAAHQGDVNYVSNGVGTELGGIQALLAAGARNVLVINVPDIGRIPEFTLGFPSQAATATSDTILYNQALKGGVSALAGAVPGASIRQFDLFALNNEIIANPAAFGITNNTQPCYLNTSAGVTTPPAPLIINPACGPIDPVTGQAANIDQFQYWDLIHPTAKVHAILGEAIYQFAVPEPASLSALALGVVATLAQRSRRRVKAAA